MIAYKFSDLVKLYPKFPILHVKDKTLKLGRLCINFKVPFRNLTYIKILIKKINYHDDKGQLRDNPNIDCVWQSYELLLDFSNTLTFYNSHSKLTS